MNLNGWKEIATHLGCGVRTAQRQEREGMPIRRVGHGPRTPVIAYSEELDYWVRHRHLSAKQLPSVADSLEKSRNLSLEVRQSRNQLRETAVIVREQSTAFRSGLRQGKDIPDGLTLIRTELRLAKTFCEIALQTGANREKRERNLENSRKAHEAVLRYRNRMALTHEQNREIERELKSLRKLLLRLEPKQ